MHVRVSNRRVYTVYGYTNGDVGVLARTRISNTRVYTRIYHAYTYIHHAYQR